MEVLHIRNNVDALHLTDHQNVAPLKLLLHPMKHSPPPQKKVHILWNRGISVATVTRLRVGRPGSDSRQGEGFLSLRNHVQTGSGT